MPSRKKISGVIAGFLGTYLSRYSDYRGYWLCGQMYSSIDGLSIDLISSKTECSNSMTAFAFHQAKEKFNEQLSKQSLDFSVIQSAVLTVTKLRNWQDQINQVTRLGAIFSFEVTVKSDLGKIYKKAEMLFIAPHDPRVEFQSARNRLFRQE